MLDRIILGDNGSLTDYTESLNEYSTSSVSKTWVAAEDVIYIGTRFPFSEKYLKASGGLGALSVSYWDGTGFRAVVDTRDSTSGLSVSGYLKFTPNRDYAWQCANSTDITELSAVTIYDQYWLKIILDTDTALDLNWVGDLFCKDSDLQAEYPDLLRPSVLTAFQSGKTDWEEQRVVASKYIVEDLMSRAAIKSSNQLFEVERFTRTAVAKTSAVIYTAFGSAYEDDLQRSNKKYSDRFNALNVLSDSDNNGLESTAESSKTKEVFLYE